MALLEPFDIHHETGDAPSWRSLLVALVLVAAAASAAILTQAG
ncbi:hypothetical protein [Piscinibacter koreensis]|nr:hypothetical protein [Schlegelella koreensis]